MYVSFKCLECNAEFIMPTQALTIAEMSGRYLTCPLDGRHKSIIPIGRYDDLKKCMTHDKYTKAQGATKQTGWSDT